MLEEVIMYFVLYIFFLQNISSVIEKSYLLPVETAVWHAIMHERAVVVKT